MKLNTKDYKEWLISIKINYQKMQIKAATNINRELIKFYYYLGKEISAKKSKSKWGTKFYKVLSKDLSILLPKQKGFSETNLKYIKYFYEFYSSICPQLEDELMSIPWGHHKCILDKCKNNPKKAIFYVQKTIENNWSRAVLLNFLDTDLYDRQGKAITNFKLKLPDIESDLAQAITKDPYSFDFLTLTENYNEKELKNELLNNMIKFLLELGKGFSFVGKEYRILIGHTEKFVDLLFYHTILHCYIVIEIKTNVFDSKYIGQLGTYITAVNHKLKGDQDNPTIGLLICKEKDNVLAQYSLEASNVPIGISEYELSKIYPLDFNNSLPTIEEIESQLAQIENKKITRQDNVN